MKLLMVSAFCVVLAPWSGAQAPHTQPARNDTRTAPVKPKQDILPQTTLDFQPVGDGLPLSVQIDFFSHIVCGADGTFYFNAEMLPSGERQVIAVSPEEDKVSSYNLASIVGLVNVNPLAIDAEGSDLYVLAEAAKSDDLINHDVKPGSPEVRKYTKNFILHFHGKPSTPDVIQLDLPFEPRQFAATSDDKFVVLGLERANQIAVLAVIDDSGELDHYIDTYLLDFGSDTSMAANAPRRLKVQFRTTPEGAPLDFALVEAQFVHYRDSLLLLMPGLKARVFTIRGVGLESMALHLPAGLEAESLLPSDSGWLIRARNGAKRQKVIVKVDPSDGEALRISNSPKVNLNEVTCVHDGNFYSIHWPRGNQKNDKAYLLEASQ